MSEKKAEQHNSNGGYGTNFYYPYPNLAYYPNQFRQFQSPVPIPFTAPQQSTQSTGTSGSQQFSQGTSTGMPKQLPPQQSYIENILRLNQGKLVDVHMNFDEGTQGERVFRGTIVAAGRDHLIISEQKTGKQYLLLMVYLNYVVFNEEINYNPAFGSGPSLFTAPR